MARFRRIAGGGGLCSALCSTIERSGILLHGGAWLCLCWRALSSRAGWSVRSRRLRAGAARIGSGDLGQRISVKTGDELEALADQFNDMAGRLQESYADLEKKVEIRTHELAQSVEELRALGEVSQAVNSTLDLETVLNYHRHQGRAALRHRCRRDLRLRRDDRANSACAPPTAWTRIDRGDQGAAHPHRRRRHRPGRRPTRARCRSPICSNEPAVRVLDDDPARRLPRAADRPAARRRAHRRRSRGPPQATGRVFQADDRSVADVCRPIGAGDPERAPVPARSRRRAGSSRSRASTSRSSSPI